MPCDLNTVSDHNTLYHFNLFYSNKVLFLFSNFQYTIVAFAVNVGEPFRKPFYTNKWFTGFLLLAMFSNFYITVMPFEWVLELLSMVKIQRRFLQYYLLPLIVANSIATLVWESVFVKFITNKMFHRKQRTRKEKLAKLSN